MKKYLVTLAKYEHYEVEAETEEEAFEMATDICDKDCMAFLDPVDEYFIKEI